MKRIIRIILTLGLLLAFVAPAAAAEKELLTVVCAGNRGDLDTVDILVISGRPYINANNAGEISGYSVIVSGPHAVFTRGLSQRTFTGGVEHGGGFWLPLEDTMAALDTLVVMLDGVLYLRAKEHTAHDLLKITDEIILNNNLYYCITDTSGAVGNIGVVLSVIYNVITTWQPVSAISGRYTEEMYKELFSDIMTVDDKSGVLDTLIAGDKMLSKLGTIAKWNGSITAADVLGQGADGESALMELVARGAVSDEGAAMSLYGKITDPIGEIIKSKWNVDIGGLNLGTQLGIFKYITSISDVCDFYVNMIAYTYQSGFKRGNAGVLPKSALRAVDQVYDYYNNPDFAYKAGELIGEELRAISFDTADDIAALAFGQKATAFTLKVERIFLDLFLDGVSGKMGFLEKSRGLTEIQAGALKLYRAFRTSPDHAINAKYAALLYLRCAQVNARLRGEADEELKSKRYDKVISDAMSQVAAVSDRDLTANVENHRIDLDKGAVQKALSDYNNAGGRVDGFVGEMVTVQGTVVRNEGDFPDWALKLERTMRFKGVNGNGKDVFHDCDMLYFYNRSSWGGALISSYEGKTIAVSGTLENYRDAGRLYVHLSSFPDGKNTGILPDGDYLMRLYAITGFYEFEGEAIVTAGLLSFYAYEEDFIRSLGPGSLLETENGYETVETIEWSADSVRGDFVRVNNYWIISRDNGNPEIWVLEYPSANVPSYVTGTLDIAVKDSALIRDFTHAKEVSIDSLFNLLVTYGDCNVRATTKDGYVVAITKYYVP